MASISGFAFSRHFGTGSLSWRWVAMVFFLAAALSFGLHFSDTLFNETRRFGSGQAASEIRLRAEDQGGRILITWNRDAEAIRSAASGVLHVDDGSRHLNMPLDPSLIASGSILYRPVTGDVDIRLELRRLNGETLTGSIRMLDGETGSSSKTVAEVLVPNSRPRAVRANAKTPHPQQTLGVVRPAEQFADAAQISETREVVSTPAIPPGAAFEAKNVPFEPMALPAPPLVSNSTQQPMEGSVFPTASVTDAPRKIVSPNAAAEQVANSAPIYVPPVPVRRFVPDLRKFGAQPNLSKNYRAEVEVRVDEKGIVRSAHLAKGQSGLPGYIGVAVLDAATRWIFQPATLRGQRIATDYTLDFRFDARR